MKESVLIAPANKNNRHVSGSRCPSCGGRELSLIYQTDKIPVHSNLMMTSQQEALEIPLGDLKLGFCNFCGFISNIAFAPDLQNYSPIYEDQQSFSPTFNAFAQELAERLVEKYNLKNKDIVEIGCGKGDFLMLLCRLGNNQGVGIDPACVEERIPEDMRERVMFIRDTYCERHANITGEMVICRHTLEHIQPTAEFVSSIRRAIGDRSDTVVFFEVPDMGRVLRELAFWDIYYEHCSYFTSGSLASLFSSCGFEILDLALDFDDQYLLLEARPTNGAWTQDSSAEVPDEHLRDVRHFSNNVAEKIAHWQKYLKRLRTLGKRTAVWGSGSKCVAFLTTLGVHDEIGCVVDINAYRHGKFIPGLGIQIRSPDYLKEYQPDLVVVMNPIYEDEIRRMLHEMELNLEVITV